MLGACVTEQDLNRFSPGYLEALKCLRSIQWYTPPGTLAARRDPACLGSAIMCVLMRHGVLAADEVGHVMAELLQQRGLAACLSLRKAFADPMEGMHVRTCDQK